MIYLDANATEPLRPEARAAAIAAMDTLGNPSSIHAAGRAARRILESALPKPPIVRQRRADFSRAYNHHLPFAFQTEDFAKVRGQLVDRVAQTAFAERAKKRKVFTYLRGRCAAQLRKLVARGGLLAPRVQILEVPEVHGQAPDGGVGDAFHDGRGLVK